MPTLRHEQYRIDQPKSPDHSGADRKDARQLPVKQTSKQSHSLRVEVAILAASR